jgi:phosphinothricin acetyltransferase
MRPRLRLAREEDASAFLEIYAPIVRETAISFELEPPGVDEYRERIRTTLWRLPWLACDENGSLVGYAYAGAFRPRLAYQWTVETTVYVRPSHHRRSVARALYTALVDVLRLQGYRSALAVIALPNAASVALHEKLGFKPAGIFRAAGFKLERWHDVGFWQLSLGGATGPPAPPRTLEAVLDSDEWRTILEKAEALLR